MVAKVKEIEIVVRRFCKLTRINTNLEEARRFASRDTPWCVLQVNVLIYSTLNPLFGC
jgi:hypothetical protein